jgi:hypothetical protein|nr:MAG TPA: hypothetical protein [Caudoviricetes sp.]
MRKKRADYSAVHKEERNDKYSVGNYVRSNNVLRMGGRK